MKKIILLYSFCSCFIAFAQASQNINYQSIALNSGGSPIINTNTGIKISILESTSTGSLLYSERHTKTTNAQGMYALVIGDGTILSGTFAAINWGTNNKWLKEVDPAGGTSYTASGTSQFLSVQYALYANTAAAVSPANSIKPVNNIAALRLYTGVNNGDIVYVKDYAGNNDGGGHFVWNNTSNMVDNGGTIITPNSVPIGRWLRKIEGTAINVKWFGILGLGADYTNNLNALISAFNDGRGVMVIFPKGIYLFNSVNIPSGFTLSGEQGVTHDLSFTTPIIIRPTATATYIFKFATTNKNSAIENLNIDGIDGPLLLAAIQFSGTANRLYNKNNNIRCWRHAVQGSPFVSKIENNVMQAFSGRSSLPYGTDASADMGYLGSMHLTNAVDNWIINNEIGTGYVYGQLSSPVAKSVAFFGNQIYSSVIMNNIFENGDKGAFIMFATGNRFSSNRYEFSESNGLELVNNAQSVFTGESFTGNGMSQNNTYSDLVIGKSGNAPTNQSSTLTFINPIFILGDNGYNITANLPKYNVTSYGTNEGYYKIKFITPYFPPHQELT